MSTSLYIVIAGCGRLGSALANRLSREGHSVVIIDNLEPSFENLSADFSGFRIEGDATQKEILEQAKLGNADIFIATMHDDNKNLMLSQVAQKIFNVGLVLARVYDPDREEIFSQLGISTICPTSMAAEVFLSDIKNYQDSKSLEDL